MHRAELCKLIIFFPAFTFLQCSQEEDNCQYELGTKCLHIAHITCYSRCPVGLLSPKPETALDSSHIWMVKFKQETPSCIELFLDEVKDVNQVHLGESVHVSATIITNEEDIDTDNLIIEATDTSDDQMHCLSQLMLEVCGCLSWQHNHHVGPAPGCVTNETISCSTSVSQVWHSVGGHCTTAVKLAKQKFRIGAWVYDFRKSNLLYSFLAIYSYPSICLSICLTIYLSICLYISLSISVSISLSIFLTISLSITLSLESHIPMYRCGCKNDMQ